MKEVGLDSRFPFQTLFLQSCATKSGTESLDLRLDLVLQGRVEGLGTRNWEM